MKPPTLLTGCAVDNPVPQHSSALTGTAERTKECGKLWLVHFHAPAGKTMPHGCASHIVDLLTSLVFL